ncbi:class II fructose-bisphosphate aldolase [Candidatus Microgenomates bacterium]|nr:class II fructose-bisphosphate aldolase [Candidatus Microgenomates bacterium]
MAKASYWFQKARKEGFAIGAFNAGSMESIKAIVAGAKNQNAPVMIEASHGEIEYFGVKEFVGVCRVLEQSHGVPIILNLDHAPDYDSCVSAIVAGFDYIHFDGSKLSMVENMGITKGLVAEAHQRDILVEGEIDNIDAMGASSSDNREKNIATVRDAKIYTDPEKAAEFVQNTGVDTFASLVGNVHGLYSQEKTLDLGLLKQIAAKIPDTFLSLHGGSGVPDDDIAAAIALGVVKINVNSELRVAFRDKLKEILNRPEEKDVVAIYKIMPEAIAAMQEIVERKIKLFGSAEKT